MPICVFVLLTPTQIVNDQIFICFDFYQVDLDNCLSANIVNSYQMAKTKLELQALVDLFLQQNFPIKAF